MAEQADRMRRLVDDLLMLSRIEQHEHARPDAAIDLGSVLKGVLDLLQLKAELAQGGARAQPRSRHCRAPSATTTSSPSCSRTWSTTPLKYAKPATTVRVAARPAGEGRVAVAVSDEGDGIPANHLPRLTERFYRVDAARSRQLGGTGLGLAIVKHVVNRHRGRLDIQSTPGKGSTFTVILPAAH